ncbi:ABC transporter permease [Exiguobacterium sp. SH31]|uniref:FtsX-like permease family protein n=1 Tax=unclassified Exiguobacterium TaxID=2644629 RepID=UPI0008C8AF3E|nr:MULTISPECIES: ABC transporter permease [unclassified Exiguobacterium]OGX79655.1 ABC transporter permease [Exiguobacterium sp. SH31]TCI71175.1 ABC transporter permease [Exiguobacterium sp. SH0S7]
MTLFDLAKKNVARNLSRYALYVGTTIFSIIIYMTFATLKHSGEISALAETSGQISGLMNASTFILLIFVALFIAYSNAFFLKGRKREVGLYSLLGVRKKQIGLILLFENLVIGAVSLVIGIGLGLIGSNFLLRLLLNLMNSGLSIGFTVSTSALVETTLVFLAIFLFTSFQGYRVIYRFKLIELFHADKKGEDVPKASPLMALIGVLTLGTAYTLALQDLATSPLWGYLAAAMPLLIIGLTVIGSGLLFHSVLIFILARLKANERWAWRRLNLLTTSQLLYRIRGNAKTLTLISIISATAITAGGAIFSVYYYAEQQVTSYAPYTFAWQGDKQDIDADVLAETTVMQKTVRVAGEMGEREYGVIDETTFQRLASGLGWVEPEPLQEQDVFLIDPFYDERFSEDVNDVTLNGATYAVASRYDETPLNVMTFGGLLLVTPDDVFKTLSEEETMYQVASVADYKEQTALSDRLSVAVNFSSATALYAETMAIHGALLFVGSFLGLVFLVATGSIIYFKTMTEAEEDRSKYAVLRKVGISKRDIKRTIRQQIAVVFLAPFSLGILHASVALFAFSRLLVMDFTVPVLVWMAVYSAIYALYYVLTVRRFTKYVI